MYHFPLHCYFFLCFYEKAYINFSSSRYNLYISNCPDLKCTAWCVALRNISLQNFFITQRLSWAPSHFMFTPLTPGVNYCSDFHHHRCFNLFWPSNNRITHYLFFLCLPSFSLRFSHVRCIVVPFFIVFFYRFHYMIMVQFIYQFSYC